jgi:hypothetical protein
MKKDKGIIFNYKNLTIRGSFVNLFFTITVVNLIIIGAFYSVVADNLTKLATLIIGTYGPSLAIWSGKKYLEEKKKKNEREEDE